jgi:peptide/nickel transport system permease protein
MSSAITPSAVAAQDLEPVAPTPTFLRRTFRETFSHTTARLGLAWICFLLFLAVFAPFLANSHPLLMKRSGSWSSPLLLHLTPGDVIVLLLPLLFAAMQLFAGSVPGRYRFWGFLAVAAGVTGLSMSWVHPPTPVVYERYREAAKAGQIEYALHAPIPYSPSDRMRDLRSRDAMPPWWSPDEEGEARAAGHWLGTVDKVDMASRMIHAARTALAVGFIATGIAVVIGVVVGGLMGYFSRGVDLVGMRVVEIFEFIPTLFLLLMFVAFYPGNPKVFGAEVPRIYFIMTIIGLTSWSSYARFVRAEFFKLRNQDFVQAAIACGLPLRSILFRHMLPNGLTPVLISASFGVAGAILAEATLSFLGLGLVDEPSWGQLLNQATKSSGSFTWWVAIFPGAAIFLTVFAYTLIGEALRDAIDPHLKRSAQL